MCFISEIYVIVILFYPSKEIISKWMRYDRDIKNIQFIFIDNTPSSQCAFNYNLKVYIPMGNNMGIAAAQNNGIKKAIKEGAKYVLFFDQDSDIDIELCFSMVEEYKRIKAMVPNLAILGPTILNKETGETYKRGNDKVLNGFAKVGALISSGSIVETKHFVNIGLMEEDLFIDAVDFEWCWRAISKGYACARTERVNLLHKVGQKNKSLLGIPFIVSSPFRYYYQYRNWLWLLRRDYVPQAWKRKTSIRRVFELFIIPFIAEHKIDTICNMWRGINNGFKV